MKSYVLTPIGIIHSPVKKIAGAPIQPTAAKGIAGYVKVAPEYVDGLKDLEGFSHIILIYYFHLSQGYKLRVKPFLDNTERGLFATRAPKRPNPIGVSIVKLKKIRRTILYIEGIDAVDGTPLLDIKPYVPEFDFQKTTKIGWLRDRVHKAKKMKADKRFK
jgi:tRNA-Thr(GGU) m(6)t(6)A37 methyltransferase TsaA